MNVTIMFDFLLYGIGICATLFTLSSTVPQIIKGIKTKKTDDLSIWLILALIVGLTLWIIYGIGKNDIIIATGNTVSVSFNVVLLFLKIKYSRTPIS
ncbi:MAG: SemiSWEET family transporter [Nitrososphaeraceae archaeon]